MAKTKDVIVAFNRGLLSPLAIARADLDRTAWSAETYSNWMPRALGPMMLRPGFQYLGATNSNLTTFNIPFIFSTDDTAIVECTASTVRVWVSDALVTRSAVTAAVTNSGFDSDVTGWTDADESGAASIWVTGGYLGLTGTGSTSAIRRQQVTVTETGTEHALNIVIQRGPVMLRVGSASGTDDYVTETSLDTGYHSLAFTPTGDFHIQFSTRTTFQVLVDSCTVASSGVMTITAPWTAADLQNIRYDQSGDIIFIACSGIQQYKIERRGTTSWSVVRYWTDDGPFMPANITATTITASSLSGSCTLTASEKIFKLTNVGSLYRLTSDGQVVTSSISTANSFTNTIRVTGTGTARAFTITIASIWSGTVTLQRSLTADTGPWEDVTTYTANTTVSYNDALDNQIAWYRIGVKTGDFDTATITNITQANPGQVTTSAAHGFTSGEFVGITGVVGMTEVNDTSFQITVVDATNFTIGVDTSGYTAYTSDGTATSAGPVLLTLDYPLGSIDGIARVTDYTSETVVSAVVLVDFGSTDATDDWAEGKWSDRRGWPSAVAIAEGRMVWAGKDSIDLSVSDSFYSFDEDTVGDSGPISKTIGSGPVDTINWLVAAKRLLIGSEGSELICRSSWNDEVLTPSNANIKTYSLQGSTNCAAAKIDNNILFVQRGGVRLFESFYENDEYTSHDLTLLNPDIGSPGIVKIAVQRQPDTRIHCIRSDGTVAVLVYDSAENITCWINLSSPSAQIEDVVILPGATGTGEDSVYYTVRRTINSSTVRYLEKVALESNCQGGTVSRQIDSHYVYSGASTATITGLSHLEAETVAVWGNGKNLGTYTVSSGSITLSEAVTDCCVGIAYTGQWQTSKRAVAMGLNALTHKKNIAKIGLIMKNTHYQGIQYGADFSSLYDLPLYEDGAQVATDTVHASYDEEPFYFDGAWDSDARVCLQANSPNPVTVLALIAEVEV